MSDSLRATSGRPNAPPPRTSSTCSHVRWGSSRSHLQLEPLLQEHRRPVLASSWGLLVLTFSSSPYSKNIVDLFSRPVGVVSFSPSVRAPPPRTSSTCSRLQLGSSRSHLQFEPLLQEHRRPVLTSGGGRLVLTFSYSPSSKDLFSPPVGVFSFSPSVRAPPPRTLSTCSHHQQLGDPQSLSS